MVKTHLKIKAKQNIFSSSIYTQYFMRSAQPQNLGKFYKLKKKSKTDSFIDSKSSAVSIILF